MREVRILATRGPDLGPALREAWERRGVFLSLFLREVQVRYRQAWLGVLWAVVQPLALVLVTTVVFHRVLRVDAGSVPYPLFVLTGLVPFTFFQAAITGAVPSLVNNADLVRKIHFPREALPIAAVGAAALDLAVGVLLWTILLLVQEAPTGAGILWTPAFLALLVLATLGPALLLSALNVHARDVKHALPLLLQVLFFATPIVYPLEAAEGAWRTVLMLNPLTAVVDGLRRTALHGLAPHADVTLVGATVAALLLVAGYALFQRAGRRFADVV